MRITYGQPCSKCGVPMAPGYGSATGYLPSPEGMRRHYAHGVCRQCGKRRPVRGTLRASGSTKEPADWVNIERALFNGRILLNVAERRAVVEKLTARGWSAARIARHLGIAQRSVVRIRTQLRKVRLGAA